MKFLISPGVTHILFDRNDYAPRRIYTDGREWTKIGIDDTTFPGYSIGEWIDKDGDGRYDELLVETRHVRNPRTWDQSGMPMADDDEGVIKERLFLDESNPAILHNEMTTIDNSLTRLSLSEIKSGRIDGANLRGVGWARYGQRPAQHATLVHPCSAIGACEHHCNIFGTIPAGGEDAARRRQRHGQGNPVGSNR